MQYAGRSSDLCTRYCLISLINIDSSSIHHQSTTYLPTKASKQLSIINHHPLVPWLEGHSPRSPGDPTAVAKRLQLQRVSPVPFGSLPGQPGFRPWLPPVPGRVHLGSVVWMVGWCGWLGGWMVWIGGWCGWLGGWIVGWLVVSVGSCYWFLLDVQPRECNSQQAMVSKTCFWILICNVGP